jgi:hypothetical protein
MYTLAGVTTETNKKRRNAGTCTGISSSPNPTATHKIKKCHTYMFYACPKAGKHIPLSVFQYSSLRFSFGSRYTELYYKISHAIHAILMIEFDYQKQRA